MPYFLVSNHYANGRVVSQGNCEIHCSRHVVKAKDSQEAVDIVERHGIAHPRWSRDIESREVRAVLPNSPEVESRRIGGVRGSGKGSGSRKGKGKGRGHGKGRGRDGYIWFEDSSGNIIREGVDPCR